MISTRIFFLIIFLCCVSLIIFGLYLEHIQGLDPCPLCVFQRIAYILIIIASLIAVIHNPANTWKTIYKFLIFIFSVMGASVAGRQVWLQHLPPELVPECGPGLDYMLNVFPFADAVRMILSGSGECAEVQWRFIGLSIAEWSLIVFIAISIATILSVFFVKK
ncbi:MAG: disulfide bond formation protein B [Legionellales bacterium]|jgi:disulfide bond formation protein DsbB|nr:disulfide bond formation protein B [Legionellales bacterium]